MSKVKLAVYQRPGNHVGIQCKRFGVMVFRYLLLLFWKDTLCLIYFTRYCFYATDTLYSFFGETMTTLFYQSKIIFVYHPCIFVWGLVSSLSAAVKISTFIIRSKWAASWSTYELIFIVILYLTFFWAKYFFHILTDFWAPWDFLIII